MKLKYLIILFGAIFIIYGLILAPNLKETFINNFGGYKKQVVEKSINTITDNSVLSKTNLIQILSTCQLNEQIINTDEADKYLVLINKFSKLEEDYIPSDLIILSSLNINTSGTVRLRKDPAEAVAKLQNDLAKEGVTIRINSGWRDFQSQEGALSYWINALGFQNGSKYAAPIGGSEHHLGTAMDIVSSENNYKLMPSYTNTKLHRFMSENAYKYGFVLSFPKGMENITGFTYEPWHFRYVGLETAKYLHDHNLSLVEYLHNIYNYCLISQ